MVPAADRPAAGRLLASVKRAIRADWLLRQANELGYRAGGVGQPRNINLRRAVSSAYYAVFHGIVLTGTDELLPDVTLEERHRLARSFSHNNLRLACQYVVKPSSAPEEARTIATNAAANASLVDVAEALLSLQEARHKADLRPPRGLHQDRCAPVGRRGGGRPSEVGHAQGHRRYSAVREPPCHASVAQVAAWDGGTSMPGAPTFAASLSRPWS